MFAKAKKKFIRPGESDQNNRIKIIMAIVFLLGIATVVKLYNLQISKGDLYRELARGQHQVASKLEAKRGNIYAYDYSDKNKPNLFPYATNKDFAFLFAIPNDIVDSSKVAEDLYVIFKKKDVEKEVDELITNELDAKKTEEIKYVESLELKPEEKQPKFDEIMERYNNLSLNRLQVESLKLKIEAEVRIRKEAVIKDYLSKLDKENDPYEPLEKKVDEETLIKFYALLQSSEEVKKSADEFIIKEGKIFDKKNLESEIQYPGLSFTWITHRYYPEKNIGSHILGYVTNTEDEKRGKYGLENYYDDILFGTPGSIKSETGAGRKVIILNDREYVEPIPGSDIVLTIDRSVQYVVCSKLNEAVKKHQADSGAVIVMKPETGEIIAMCSSPDFDPNEYDKVKDIGVYNNTAIFSQYEPGSVFKPITMAAAIDQERVTPETTYLDEGQIMINGWPKPIRNSDFDSFGGHGVTSMNTVLELSLNTGAIFAMRQIGGKVFVDYVKKFGFGEPTGIELGSEGAGNLSHFKADPIPEIYTATASFGQGITVTPIQMATAFNALANGGVLMKPFIIKEIIHPDGTKEETKPKEIRRVVSERAAALIGGMMVNIVEVGHSKPAQVKGYYVGAKTGTAQIASSVVRGYSGRYNHTVVGYAPIEEPAFVILTKIEAPKDAVYAESTAAPLFGEIAKFLLNYYQIPKER